MTRLRIGGYQMHSNSPDIGKNAERILRGIRQSAEQDVAILSFPECALTPFFPLENTSEFDRYFVSATSEVVREICGACERHGIAAVLPIAESDGANFYNSALFIDGGRIVATYRKSHMPGAFIGETLKNFEKAYFTPGNCGFPVVAMKGVKVGVQICYDRHFPEGYRALALQGAELVFNATAAGTYGKAWRSDTWEVLLRARAFENNLFVFGINKHGPEYDQIYFGQSMLTSPLGGAVVTRASDPDVDELISAEIDTADVVQAHKRLPWRRDFRPELYRSIYAAL